jgi:glycosyltransferase involved in cell wall biosynthesis
MSSYNNKISVTITSYNQKYFLNETIKSVLNQTLKPYEIIIADDCSTDGSIELIKSYAEEYSDIIIPIYHKKNLGIAKNRNSAFKKASGKLISWINGDDLFLPKKLEFELKTFLKNNKTKWVYSQVFYIDSMGNKIDLRYKNDFIYQKYNFKDIILNMGKEPAYQLIDYSILDEVGFFDENIEVFEDWDFVIRLAKNNGFDYCPIPLSEYRQHSAGASKSDLNIHIHSVEKIFQKIMPLIVDLHSHDQLLIKNFIESEILKMYALKSLEDNNRVSAAKYLTNGFLKNPKNHTFFLYYSNVLFPKTIVNLLKKILINYRKYKNNKEMKKFI